MENESWIKLNAPVVKIGNSFSIRIPMNTIKELGVEEGRIIMAKIRKFGLDLSPEVVELWCNIARLCKAFRTFSDEKILLLTRLLFAEGIYSMQAIGNKPIDEKNKTSIGKMARAREEYRATIKKEFGRKVQGDYIKFRGIMERKMKSLE